MNIATRTLALAAAMSALALSGPAAHATNASPSLSSGQIYAQPIQDLKILIAIKRLSCVVSGTPVEFPDDIVLTNVGNVTLAAGTLVRWYVHNGAQGYYTLPAALPVGATVFIGGVIPGGWAAGAVCAARIVG